MASLQESCVSGKILDTTTLHAGGHDIKVTTKSCPAFSHTARQALPLGARADTIEKRQNSVCNGTRQFSRYEVVHFILLMSS
jgi:hypothetical protein